MSDVPPCPPVKRKKGGSIVWTQGLKAWLRAMWTSGASLGEIEQTSGIRHDMCARHATIFLGLAPRPVEDTEVPVVERKACGHVIWTPDLDNYILARFRETGELAAMAKTLTVTKNTLRGRLWRFPELRRRLDATVEKPPGKWNGVLAQPLWDKPSLETLPSLTRCLHMTTQEPVVFCDAPTIPQSNYCERHAR
jgi:hypothetical protein